MDMLTNSFIFLDGVGPASERKYWQEGMHSWKDFLAASRIRGVSPAKKFFCDKKIRSADEARKAGDASFFSSLFVPSQAWRLFEEFKDEAVYLDIETANYYGDITIIGLFDGKDTKIMVKGFNLNREVFEEEMRKYKLIITFNGGSFDLPVIRRYFGECIPKIPHIDLRGVCSKVGLVGGLKSIERQIGIERPDDVKYVYGDDAVWLWHKFKETKDQSYLETLIRYNEEDIMNLKPLAELAVKKLWKKTFILSSGICDQEPSLRRLSR